MAGTQQQDRTIRQGARLLVGGGIVGALLASSCCILPVALFSLGISGAWIGNFTQLAPYQPYFVAAALACLGGGYWLMRRSEQVACADDAACSRPLPNRLVRLILVAAALLIAAAVGFDYVAPYILS
jgi:mercuric ion transport protein